MENLLALQNLDLDLLKIKEEMEEIPAQLLAIDKKETLGKEGMKKIEEEGKKNLLLNKTLEGEIAEKKEKLKKVEFQLNSVKTNEEYGALLKEIAFIKEKITQTEDKILGLMEEGELHQGKIDIQKKILNEAILSDQKIVGDLKNKLNQLKDFYKNSQEKRKELAAKLSGELFDLYEKFFQKKKSVALVPIEKNGTCGGCRWHLPPDNRNNAMKGKIVRCDNCSRLLYWEKEEDEQTQQQEIPVPLT